MATITFDTLKFVEILENAGVKREHATAAAAAVREAQETALTDHAKEQHASNAQVVAELETKTERGMFEMKTELKAEIQQLSAKFDLLEQRTHSRFAFLQWMLGILIAGVLALVMRAFFFPALPSLMPPM